MTIQSSVWLGTASLPRYQALDADQETDVVVVGGGLIGLTTALHLQQEGVGVVLLEGGRIATRTSGNTTGKVTSQHGAVYAGLLDRHGRDKAQQYAAANQEAVDEVDAIARRLGIDCELSRGPSYVYSTGDLRDEAEAARELGLPAQLADPLEMGLPLSAASAVRFDNQLLLHPARYLAGLASAFTGAGGRIFERTRVTELNAEGDGVEARTESGRRVVARHAVAATLLPFGTLGGYFARTRPNQSHGIAVKLPVQAPTAMTISAEAPTRSTRPWPGGGPNGLIVVGADHETGGQEDTNASYQSLVDWVDQLWGTKVQPEYRWSAEDYSTADQLPYVGKAPGSPVLVATGMHKWGLSNGTVAAGILRDLVLGRSNRWSDVFDAGRIGDARSVAKLVQDNLKVGKEFAAGHLRRLLGPGLDHVEVGEGGLFDLDGTTVGAYRDQGGTLHTVVPVCTHLGCPLRWNQGDSTWDCNCHGSRFAPDGAVLDGPATSPLEKPDQRNGKRG
ncbi:FAD-dependent oxidoreductase [Kribbella shirazensis]|uniref:Glycine/D-amino acid oxidase-like deaminating enzyme/nitrite reductase/ring-hydroxylating ferredoxin subunit n=1 Tax=Kribbella shirazensis TaxID=1105143 RepID=A0A7X6A259_9ACTN|nr:FAD-dependent oxidoreductase [Kribbella shirazensis]NIK58952.1 glycine/D-amino acid oxidase-like deaminating enzyme/nitrite reductase/ring-hydroxylating ferredoxin subunit [Kribbella shirazensis]